MKQAPAGRHHTLTGRADTEGGEIAERNFDSYEIPRVSWGPRIETVLIDNRQDPSQGCGEPPIVCMGAVIANAIYGASGVRLHQLPMAPDQIRQALSKV